MKSMRAEGVVAFMSIVVPVILLSLALRVSERSDLERTGLERSGLERSSHRIAHNHAMGQGLTRLVSAAIGGCTMNRSQAPDGSHKPDRDPGPHVQFLIRDMISTAVSIADRL